MPVTHLEVVQEFRRARAVLRMWYKWFIHQTAVENLDGIRTCGLQPSPDAVPPADVEAHLGPDARRIVALHPLGAQLRPTGSAQSPQITLALGAEHLPDRIGLDWSYIPNVADPPPIFGRELEHVVLYNAQRFGSVISYDPIDPITLRVFSNNCPPDNPLAWPLLPATDRTRIYTHGAHSD